MLELGKFSRAKHLELKGFLDKIDKVICIGDKIKELFSTLEKKKQLLYLQKLNKKNIEIINSLFQKGDIVLLKSSNKMHLSKIIQKS